MGYLTPSNGVAYDQDLEDIFHELITGVTSIKGSLVRPRWQPEPPPMPTIGTDWCAFAVRSITPDDGPYITQSDDQFESVRHEEIELMISFYGDKGQSIANIFRDGLGILQNIDQIKQHKIKFVGCSDIRAAPDLLNNQYVHRFDVVATFRRKTKRAYAM